MTDSTATLLIVDDDTDLAGMLGEYLELEGFRVGAATNGEAALQQIAADPPQLVILDVMLPGMDGFEVLRLIRKSHDLPVIMLTARGQEWERIQGLTGGADDYLPKPFNPVELAARVRNVLRRYNPADNSTQAQQIRVGPLHMDLSRREALVDGNVLRLTAAEFGVLEQFMRKPGEVLTKASLTEQALHRPLESYDRSIDTLISKLRKKLSAAGLPGEYIRSLRGHGYVLDLEAQDNPQ